MVLSRTYALDQEYCGLSMIGLGQSSMSTSQYLLKKICHPIYHQLNVFKILCPLYIELFTS